MLVPGPATRGARTVAPLIGREDESALLLSLFERVGRESRPHLVTVIGQAGVGKSRLLRELAAQIGGRPEKPAFRVGRCPAYGAGLAYWALGEILRGQFELVDTDDSELAWTKLLRGVESVVSDAETDEPPERIAATIARPLGIEPPAEHAMATGVHELDDPQQIRDRLFSAVRSLVEAVSRQRPVVIALEDIHWADEGMLDLIEYLARWVRGPALIVCMARDELLDRRPGWGGGRRNATTIALEPLSQDETRELVTALLPGGNGNGANGSAELVPQVAERSAGNPLFAEEMVNRIREEGSQDVQTLPETVHAVLAARLDSLSAPERRVLQHASVVGQTFWEGSLAGIEEEEGIDLQDALMALQEKDLVVPSAGSRLAGEHEYAFKHVLIRDVAYSTLPKSVRAWKHAQVGGFIEERAADRSEGVVAMVADHYGRARRARRRHRDGALGARARQPQGPVGARGRRRRRRLAVLQPGGAGPLRDRAVAAPRARSRHARPDRREARRRRPPARARRPGHRGLGAVPRLPPPARRTWRGSATCTARSAPGSGTRATARARSSTTRRGSTCSRTARPASSWCGSTRRPPRSTCTPATTCSPSTPPRRRCDSRSDSARRRRQAAPTGSSAACSAASATPSAPARTWSARSSWRASPIPAEAVRALLTLGYHLEVSEADYAGRRRRLPGGARARRADGRPSLARSSCTPRSPSSPPMAGDWESVEREAEASGQLAEREGLTGKLCFPYMMRGMLRWREGRFDESAKGLRRAADLAEQVGRSEVAFQSLFWLAASLRQRGDHADADTELARALDLCERAGLVAQSVEAISARAVNLALAGTAGRGARGRRRGRAARRPAPLPGRQGGKPRGPRRRGGRSGRVERRAG